MPQIAWLENKIEKRHLKQASLYAEHYKCSGEEALIAIGAVKKDRLIELLGDYLGVRIIQDIQELSAFISFNEGVAQEEGQVEGEKPSLDQASSMVPVRDAKGNKLALLSPKFGQFSETIAQLKNSKTLCASLGFVPPSIWHNWHESRNSNELVHDAQERLSSSSPELSAKGAPAHYWIICIAFFVFISGFFSMFAAGIGSFGLHVLASIFFAWCILLRFIALVGAGMMRLSPARSKQFAILDAELPDYTIMVALYKESNQVRDLLVSLRKLDWPAHKLQIKLILEEDDTQTILAAREQVELCLCDNEQLIIVPRSDIRTKPRALNYALSRCDSEFVVLYDAEDRPAADQLKQAYIKFKTSSEKLACVQAPLLIRNANSGFLPTMFAFEYAALFRAYLPGLVKMGIAFPLGGTSNHLKVSALKQVGGWDAYNVTEDADLGVRLTRAGYRLDVIDSPTIEEAPVRLSVWVKQRTRWFKGWLQTCTVHFRQPVKAFKQLGWLNSLGFCLIFGGTLLSALLQPWIYWAVFKALNTQVDGVASMGKFMSNIDLIEIYLSYVAYICLVFLGTSGIIVRHVFWWPLALPIYWALSSYAAWRALIQFQRDPYYWEKTPHGE